MSSVVAIRMEKHTIGDLVHDAVHGYRPVEDHTFGHGLLPHEVTVWKTEQVLSLERVSHACP